MTRSTKPTHPHFTLPAILPAMITGLFILTACGGSVLTNDAPIAPDVQKNACETNPLAEGCQAGAGFLSVNFGEDTGNQEAESSEAPPAPPTPAPITSVDTSHFVPETSYSTQSAPAQQNSGYATGQQSAPVTTALITGRQTTRNTATPKNEFLAGGADELDRGDAPRGDPLRMNLAQAYHDGAAIGFDEEDGIDFFTVNNAVVTKDGDNQVTGITNSRYHYAGILSGTDLGAPVSSDVASATWNGSFRTYNTNAVDFQLTVGFGTTDQTRTIAAFVKDGATPSANNYYLLAGTYTPAGLITGTVNWGEFSDIAMRTPTDGETSGTARTANGTLTGLIGVQGAVGVFYSDTNDDATSGGYAGGFVASASLPDERVTYRDWAESFDVATTGGVVETPSLRAEEDDANSDLFNQFLATREGATALDETGAGTVTQRGGLTLADDVDSGVSFFSNGISLSTLTVGSQSYAGLLAGTDLGAPINDVAQVGEWKGQFKSVGGYYYGDASIEQQRIETAVDTDFTLTVTFGAVGGVPDSAGSIEAFVTTSGLNRRFLLAGTYDANGLITGTVIAGLFNNDEKGSPSNAINGTLTGLIGAEGAVGAFISNPDAANYNYAGGFVAALPEDTVNLADWTASFAAGGFNAGQDDLFAAGTDVTTIPSGTGRFIQWSDTRDFTPGGSLSKFSAGTDILLLNDEPNNGIGFRYNVSETSGRGFAGLLSATDMGAPLTDTSKNTIWTGKIVGVASAVALAETELRLKVTYGASFTNGVGTIQSIANQTDYTYATSADTVGAVNVRSNFPNTFNFDGGFDANGVITGTIAHTLTAPGGTLRQNGVFSGLIGVRGAVGVFKNDDATTNLPFVGGFVVVAPE